MNMLARLLHRQVAPAGEVGLHSVRFNTAGFRVERKAADVVERVDLIGDRVVAAIERDVEWHAASLDVGGLRERRRAEAACRGGGIVCLDIVAAAGLPVVQSIVKLPDGLGYVYEASLAVPLRGARFTLTMNAREHGMTGIRESALTMLLLQEGLLPIPTGPPGPAGGIRMERWLFDPYDGSHDGDALCSLSDDARLDPLFAKHPLPKVRSWLASAVATLDVDEEVRPALEFDWAPSAGATRISEQVPSDILAKLYVMANRLDLAEPMLRDTLPTRNGEPSTWSAGVAGHLLMLALVRENLGALDGAAWAYARASRMYESTVAADDLRADRARAGLGRVLLLRGELDEAEPLLRAALASFLTHGADADAAVSANDVGLLSQRRNDHRGAVAWFEMADERFAKVEGSSRQPIADRVKVLANLSASLEALGDHRRAKAAKARMAALPH